MRHPAFGHLACGPDGPTLLLGLVAYTSSSSVINEQTQSLLETQVHDMRGWTNDVYKLTRNKVNSDLNVARQNFYGMGTPQIIEDKMTLVDNKGNTYVVNNNFEIVDKVQSLVGGAATVFQVYPVGGMPRGYQPMCSITMDRVQSVPT